MQWNLIKLRKERKLNQEKMATIAMISKDAYGRKERGEFQFTMDEMFLISEYLDKPIGEIFLPRDCIKTAIKEEKQCSN